MEFSALLGVALGWLLHEASAYLRRHRDWKRRLKEIKIDTYSEWAAGMEENLIRYARQDIAAKSEFRTPLCEKRLELIESDEKAHALIRQVHASIPPLFSDEHEALADEAQSDPEWDWPPFRKAMDALVQHVRGQLHR